MAVFRNDLKKTIQGTLLSELSEHTDEECEELADIIVTQIDLDHEIVEDEDDFLDDDDEEESFIDDEMDIQEN